MNLNDFLVWMAFGGGGSIAASWLLERFNWFQALQPEQKKMVFFALTVTLTIGGLLAIQLIPAATIALLTPYFSIVVISFVSVFVGDKFHSISKEKK